MPASRTWQPALRWLQVSLIVLAFGFDYLHGIQLGQRDIGFQPIYRLREALAVAISRLREPPLHGYIAYQSVIDAFNNNGFGVPWENGLHLDAAGVDALVLDPVRLERTLQEARRIPLDTQLPPDLTAGNELAFSDYAYVAFAIFGVHMSSLYYFYFALLGASCTLFIAQYRSSPFAMFLLLTYLASLGFVENYVSLRGAQFATLVNSRFFDVLSLLPAAHMLMLMWIPQKPTRLTLIAAVTQSILLAFLIDCRITGRWQIAMIAATALGFVLAGSPGLWRRHAQALMDIWRRTWPAVVAVGALAAHMTAIDLLAHRRYGDEPKYHVVWHEVLRGLLGSNEELQRQYLGNVIGLGSPPDQAAYDALDNDLTQRDDRTSPIVVLDRGRLRVDVSKGWAEYERLARLLVFEMIRRHPSEVLMGLYNKAFEQNYEFTVGDTLSLANLASAACFAGLGLLIWLAQGGANTRRLGTAAGGAMILVAFATIPPMVAPSPLSIGTLLSYVIALWLGAVALLVLVARVCMKLKSNDMRAVSDRGRLDEIQ
jgi:hypothetical protein